MTYYISGALSFVMAYVFRAELGKIGSVGHSFAMEFNSSYISDDEEEGGKTD